MTTKLMTPDELSEVITKRSECKPESEWACLQPGYMEWLKEKIKDNTLLTDRHNYARI
jgi:hypothetical protein